MGTVAREGSGGVLPRSGTWTRVWRERAASIHRPAMVNAAWASSSTDYGTDYGEERGGSQRNRR
jgi:hypothetical protein